MKNVLVSKNGKIRKLSESSTFSASILGSDGFLYRQRIDNKDYPYVYNIERNSVLSISETEIIVNNKPDKNIPNHHSNRPIIP